MKDQRLFIVALVPLLLLIGLSGCGGEIAKAGYPYNWSPRITHSKKANCPDISGSYKITGNQSILPFLLFGIVDTRSPEWNNLVQIYGEQLLPDLKDAAVTIGHPNSEHIDVAVIIHGKTVAKQVLMRSHQSYNNAVWFGQNRQSFRCESDLITINSAYIHDWDVYTLPLKEKKRRFRTLNFLGIAVGYFDFSKNTDGSLVMRARRYYCYPCDNLDEFWLKWEPVHIQTVP